MAESTFDVVVVGGGPGGYVCAIRAAQLGFKVACVEKRSALGGTCLNVGCIPSKALLSASEKFEEAKHGLAKFGIKVGGVELDLPGMLSHKDKVVKENTQGIEFLFKKNKIAWLKGAGRITAPNTVEVEGVGTITANKAIVIATGSEVTPLPGIEIDEQKIVSSTGALELPEVPKRLVVIGGGVIGLELGSVWGRLGSQVTVVEFLDRILPTMDGEVSKQMQRILAKQGMTFKLGAKVTAAKVTNTGVTLSVEPAAGGTAEEVEADVVLVAIGRRAYTNGLGLDAVGVEMDNRGRVKIGKHFETNVPGIYAIGDVVEGPMLAHKAEEEGVALAELLAGQAGHVNHDLVPGVVYTWPEVAAVGKTEEELKAAGVQYKAGKFPFLANGRARAMAATDGFVKILADAHTDKVLGVHMVGPNVSEMVAELAVAMEFGASSEDIGRTCHAHPTLSEVTKEAALAVEGRAIHI
ncbi:dihydrolipoyl dehydrogenase [Azospirillum rugosum]|uniref:Dihydrolipoyl dehydrogenase n=1 Tax=Azospirillum rugosum TaxID=416170 RepID=A0ABS4SRL9_9PROT|nr:dihydrolipoyl dehydrogenase [Azospirillum rugosum]MBP2295211.1 dihydrolipoamide dehydrogenase [Azospirillum rugosum]MDQ0528585.1 dihydrolipoamide dehydrogenase [Azospirillum rugosum]